MSVRRFEGASSGEVVWLTTVSRAESLEFVTQPIQKCKNFVKPVMTFFGAYGSALSGVGGPTGLHQMLGSGVTTL